MRAFLKVVGIPLSVIPSIALPLVLVASADDRGAAEQDYRSLPALPAQAEADEPGSLDALAVELADRLRAVPVDASGAQTCAPDRLRVSYAAPGDGAQHGAHLDPLGPVPTDATRQVNGVVVCATSGYGFMGFEAWRDGGQWRIAAVPFVSEQHDETPGAVAEPPHAEPALPAAPPAPVLPAPAIPTLGTLGGPIESYARYEPQRICDPAAKPGTLALRNLLLARNPGTRSLGISRNCGAGGTSEHKEGRALDWGVLASRPNEAAAAERFIDQLMATDAAGHRHALARRMGVMYVIWNRRMWSAYRPEQGWRPYSGPSPHTDHVHVSLSWAGATGRTSFWSGKVDPAALLASAPVASTVSRGAAPHQHVARRLPAALPTEALRAELGGRAARRAVDPATGNLDPNRLSGEWRARWDQMTPEQQAEVRRRMEGRAERRRGRDRGEQRRHDDRAGHADHVDEAAPAEQEEAPRESRAEERAAREQARAERQARREAERQAEHQRREAARAAAEEAHREAKAEHRAEREAQRPERQQRADGEHGRERAEARQREQAERQAQRQAAREAEQQRRAEAREQRHAERREQATVQQGDGGGERRGGHGRGRGEGRGGNHRRD